MKKEEREGVDSVREGERVEINRKSGDRERGEIE